MTAAAGINPWKDSTGEPSSDVSGFAAALDWVAIMNYDEYGQWSSSAGPNAALNDSCAPTANQQGSAVSAVKAWIAAGIPANQLVLGVASYGHAFNVTESSAFSTDACADDSELSLFPAFSPWTYGPGEPVSQECGENVAKDVQYTFAELVQAGFLGSDGKVADGIHARYDDCSQTVSLHSIHPLSPTHVSFAAICIQRVY
jgi:chitinase